MVDVNVFHMARIGDNSLLSSEDTVVNSNRNIAAIRHGFNAP
jgi:hypothetical protein